jgi:hypothetical protein
MVRDGQHAMETFSMIMHIKYNKSWLRRISVSNCSQNALIANN